MPLEPYGAQHLGAAHGYLELGMCLDADAELDKFRSVFLQIFPLLFR